MPLQPNTIAIYELWESADLFVLVECCHPDKAEITHGCSLTFKVRAISWEQANEVCESYRKHGYIDLVPTVPDSRASRSHE